MNIFTPEDQIFCFDLNSEIFKGIQRGLCGVKVKHMWCCPNTIFFINNILILEMHVDIVEKCDFWKRLEWSICSKANVLFSTLLSSQTIQNSFFSSSTKASFVYRCHYLHTWRQLGKPGLLRNTKNRLWSGPQCSECMASDQSLDFLSHMSICRKHFSHFLLN